jgi:hypothetical protein
MLDVRSMNEGYCTVVYCNILYRPNCMEQHNTSSEATGRSDVKNPVPLLNPKVYKPVHDRLPLVPNLNHSSPRPSHPIYYTYNFGNPPNLVPGLQNGLFPSYVPD